jgi:hypothetical protein
MATKTGTMVSPQVGTAADTVKVQPMGEPVTAKIQAAPDAASTVKVQPMPESAAATVKVQPMPADAGAADGGSKKLSIRRPGSTPATTPEASEAKTAEVVAPLPPVPGAAGEKKEEGKKLSVKKDDVTVEGTNVTEDEAARAAEFQKYIDATKGVPPLVAACTIISFFLTAGVLTVILMSWLGLCKPML